MCLWIICETYREGWNTLNSLTFVLIDPAPITHQLRISTPVQDNLHIWMNYLVFCNFHMIKNHIESVVFKAVYSNVRTGKDSTSCVTGMLSSWHARHDLLHRGLFPSHRVPQFRRSTKNLSFNEGVGIYCPGPLCIYKENIFQVIINYYKLSSNLGKLAHIFLVNTLYSRATGYYVDDLVQN